MIKVKNIVIKTRKGVSPVIATVILVAVAITIAVGVSYWMGGISSQYTQFEKIEIQTGYAVINASDTYWNVTMVLKNSGSADATITNAFLNDVPCDSGNYGATTPPVSGWGVSYTSSGVSLVSGQAAEIYILIDEGYLMLSSGTTINIKLHSAGGMDYVKLIRLP